MNEWVELGQNKDGTHNICCGVCGVGKFKSKGHARSYYTRHKFKYCPNCGAKMADRKTEPTISKMEQVDKDINVRSKTEPEIDGAIDEARFKAHCMNCQRDVADIKCLDCDGDKYFIKDEPQTDKEIILDPSFAELSDEQFVEAMKLIEPQTDCSWK